MESAGEVYDFFVNSQLLNLVKLTDRTMDDVSYEKLTEEIDFTYANEQIARFREHSMEQLRQMTSED